MHWDFNVPGQVSLSMDGYVNEIISNYQVKKMCITPATDKLFVRTANSPLLTRKKQEIYHSCVMTLHYYAKRVAPTILTAVSYCATTVLAPTEEDEQKLDRILSYILYSRDQKLLLRIGNDLKLVPYIDASFGVYEDGKSVTGVVIMIGNASIYAKSGKQKIVTRSSAERELVAISDALSQVLWTREYHISEGLQLGPTVVFQDNQSTIFLANKGRSTSERTRHIKIRYFFCVTLHPSKRNCPQILPTADMIADILTKPLHGSLFIKLRDLINGNVRILVEHTASRKL
jgi:hypothetical protein